MVVQAQGELLYFGSFTMITTYAGGMFFSEAKMQKFFEVIPNIYYDAIARMLPGVICIAYVFYCSPVDGLHGKDRADLSIWLVAGGYVLGLALTALSSFLRQNFREDAHKARNRTYDRLDGIACLAPEFAVGLWKMLSETVLFENLAVGFIVAIPSAYVVSYLSEYWNYSGGGPLVLTLLLPPVLGVLAYCVACHRGKLLELRMSQVENRLKRPLADNRARAGHSPDPQGAVTCPVLLLHRSQQSGASAVDAVVVSSGTTCPFLRH